MQRDIDINTHTQIYIYIHMYGDIYSKKKKYSNLETISGTDLVFLFLSF